jgi:hypothetical protein
LSTVAEVLREFERPFAYDGKSDCCAFAGALVEAIRGVNPMDRFDYDNKFGCYKNVPRNGTLLDAVTEALGTPMIEVEGVEDGDVLAVQQKDGTWVIGTALWNRMAVKTPQSIMDWPIEYASHRWSTKCLK